MVFAIVIDVNISMLSPGHDHNRAADSSYLTACQVIDGFLKKGVAIIPRQQFVLVSYLSLVLSLYFTYFNAFF
uniref:Ku_N domain-containing protein n=1 Tax=Heterorhabditis bacteriophora TaxID=37862 RepID=A0A1I7WVA0_HETBA